MPFEKIPSIRRTSVAADITAARKQLLDIGPLAKVEIHIDHYLLALKKDNGEPIPDPVEGWALIDTGARDFFVMDHVADTLGLQAMGFEAIQGAVAESERPIHHISLAFPEADFETEPFRRVISLDVDFTHPKHKHCQIIAIIGRDLLSQLTFIYSGRNATYTMFGYGDQSNG